jgi:CRP-like cAMP-binding protein
MEERSRTNRIIRKSQRGDGLTHLEMPHSTLEASVSAGLRAEPSPVNASSASLAAAAAVAASARPAGSVTSPPSGGTTGAAPGATAAGDAEAPEAHWARVLGEIEILSQLDRPHLEDLAQLAAMRHVKRGERLRAPHAPAAALTVVLKGEVALWRSEDERRRTADGPDLASRLGAGFVASLAAAEGSGGGVVDAFAAGFAAGSEPTPQDETSGIGSWAGDTGGAGGFGGNPSRREAAPTPIRVFGAGCRCSSFLDLLLGLLTPASCLPMPQAFAGLGGPPAHASHPSVLAASAAGPCSILEISADALAQLAQRNRALVQGLAEVVLLRLSLVTCDALASYIELPLHLSPKPALPPPPPPPQGGWRARAAEMHAAGIPKGETATRGHAGGSGGASSSCGNGMGLSLGNSLAGLMAPAGGAGQRGPVWAGEVGAGAGSAASASATKGCADSPAPAPTPAGPANARAALLAHACKWVRSALHVSPEDDLPAELLYLAPGESYFPAAHAPTVLVHLWGRARAQPVPLPGAEGGEPKQNTSGDGGGGRDAGSGVAGQPPPPPHVPALGEVRKGARWLSAGEVLGLRSVLTRQHLAEGVAVPGGGKPTRAGVGASLGSSPGSPVPAGAPFCRPAGLTPGAEAGGGGGGSSRSSGASGSRSSGHNGGSGGSVLASVAAGLASVDVSGTGNAGRSAPEPSPTGAECGAFLLVLSTAALRSLCRRRPAVLLRLGAMLLHSLPPLLWTLDHCVEWRVLRSGDHAEVPTEEVVVLVLCGRLRIFPCAPTKDSTEQQGAPVAADEMRGSELLGPRDSYGEDDVLLCKPQARRAIAVRDTQLIYLSGEKALPQHPDFAPDFALTPRAHTSRSHSRSSTSRAHASRFSLPFTPCVHTFRFRLGLHSAPPAGGASAACSLHP